MIAFGYRTVHHKKDLMGGVVYNEYVGCSLKLDDRLDFASLAVYYGAPTNSRSYL